MSLRPDLSFGTILIHYLPRPISHNLLTSNNSIVMLMVLTKNGRKMPFLVGRVDDLAAIGIVQLDRYVLERFGRYIQLCSDQVILHSLLAIAK